MFSFFIENFLSKFFSVHFRLFNSLLETMLLFFLSPSLPLCFFHSPLFVCQNFFLYMFFTNSLPDRELFILRKMSVLFFWVGKKVLFKQMGVAVFVFVLLLIALEQCFLYLIFCFFSLFFFVLLFSKEKLYKFVKSDKLTLLRA